MNQKNRVALAELSVEQYDTILNHCNSNIFVTDGKGCILYANDAAERALNCSFEQLHRMDIYQLQEEGYTTHSSSADAIRTGKKAFAVYRNNLGEEIATTSIPVMDSDHTIMMVVTRSDEVGTILSQQKELDRYRSLYKQMLSASAPAVAPLIVKDKLMEEIIHRLKRYSDSDVTILLTGESGTGKEVLANYIQQNSQRRNEAFLSINCAAIPNELIESELFGYVKGAFTGASREGKAGIFELADGGTIFLDEVGELSLMAQSKLLRVLESGEFMRVGSTKNQKTNVRVIAATNRDLKAMVKTKEFRADLYYRLCVVPVEIPPLRDRPADIGALAVHFLGLFNRKHRMKRELSPAFLERLQRCPWPGNIRELRNAMENYVITGEEPALSENHPAEGETLFLQDFPADLTIPLKAVMEQAEAGHIRAVLKACDGDVAKAADHLGIHRSVLYKKINKYHMRQRTTYD